MKYFLSLLFGVLFATMLVSQSKAIKQGVFESFETGLAGWQPFISKTKAIHESSGGNPGGFIKADGQTELGFTTIDPKYTGNYSNKGFVEFEVDLVALQCVSVTKPQILVRFDAGDNGWSFPFNDFSCNHKTWKTYKAPFKTSWSDAEAKAAGWVQVNGSTKTFSETMNHVGRLGLYMSVSWKISQIGMDNFRINAKDMPVQKNVKKLPIKK